MHGLRREHGTPSSPRQVSAHRRTGLLSWPWRTILRTYHPGCCPGSWAGPTPPGYEYYDKISQEAAQSLLDQAKDRLGRECETQLLVGKTEEVVTESLSHADLLILARDGDRSRLGPKSIGRHTRFVLDHAPCTVALVWPGETPPLESIPETLPPEEDTANLPHERDN